MYNYSAYYFGRRDDYEVQSTITTHSSNIYAGNGTHFYGWWYAYADYKTKLTLAIESSSSSEEAYVITIPTSLIITKAGWNAFDPGIKASAKTGTTFSGTLTITASSDNKWSLVLSPDKSDSVSYVLASQDNNTQNLTWTFTADEITADGTTKPAGVIVEEYASHTAGDYEDTITFTASVEETAELNGTIVVRGYFNTTSKPFSATATLKDGTLSDISTNKGALYSMSLTYSDGHLTISMARATSNKTVIVDLSTGNYTQKKSGVSSTVGRIHLTGITLNGNAITLTPAS